jgi:hypothetical protein
MVLSPKEGSIVAVEFTIQPIDNYLYVTVVGEIITYEDIISFGRPYRLKAQELGIKRILVDYRKAESRIDYYGMIMLARHIRSTKFHYNGFRIANLVAPEALQQFLDYQVPAANRGVLFESFSNEEEALAWLLMK